MVIKKPQMTTKPTHLHPISGGKQIACLDIDCNEAPLLILAAHVNSFHEINCMTVYVAAIERSLGTLVQVETSSRGSRGSWYRAH